MSIADINPSQIISVIVKKALMERKSQDSNERKQKKWPNPKSDRVPKSGKMPISISRLAVRKLQNRQIVTKFNSVKNKYTKTDSHAKSATA